VRLAWKVAIIFQFRQNLQLMVAGIISHLAPIVVILNEAGR
jgi:hypothetical protein